MAAKVVSKSPVSAEALNEVLTEVGAKGGFVIRSGDGDPVVIEAAEIAQDVLDWAVSQAKARKTKRQSDQDLRTSILAKTSWTNTDRDQAIRLLLERLAI